MRYTETEALVAVLGGDEDQCQRLLSQMLPHELHELMTAAGVLRSLALDVYRQGREGRTRGR